MITSVINKAKQFKKRRLLNDHPIATEKYAFIGVGSHSIQNLYPCLKQLNVNLKWIYSRHEANARKMAANYSGSTPTDNLEAIANDDEVKGVFICSDPQTHLNLVALFLGKGKFVFVEKPLGFSRSDILKIATLENQVKCVVGLQKRYGKFNAYLTKQKTEVCTYNYRYLAGKYIEGDPVYELYIHALDNVVNLFGEVAGLTIEKKAHTNGNSFFLVLRHKSGTLGSIELSDCFSWNHFTDSLSIRTETGEFEVSYPDKLIFNPIGTSYLSLVKEKFGRSPKIKHIIFDNEHTLPVIHHNQLYSSGYYNELKYFIAVVESGKMNENAPASLIHVYYLLDQLKKQTD